MDHRHVPNAPNLETLLGQAQQFAEAYWDAYPQLDWQQRHARGAFANAFPWAHDLS